MTFAPQPRPAAAAPLPMRVVSIPRLAQGGRWRVEAMRALSEPVLLWFTRGQGRITVAGLTRGYGGHNAVFIPAGTMHGFEAGPGVLGSAVFFGRTPAHPLPARPLHLRLRDAARQAEFTALLDSLRAETESSRPGRERAAALYLGLIGVWLERNAAQADAAPADAARRLAQRFTDLIEAEFRTGAGVAAFAERLGVTPTHLTRVCRQTCGRSALGLLHDRRLFEARRLLHDTRLPVKDVASSLGFTSAAYFTRAFQHATGQTPSDFRARRP